MNESAERRTGPVELFWDLVFVFAVTQVTTLLAHSVSWAHLGEALLVLALIWWSWSAFVWAANAEPESSTVLRACLLAGTVLIFIAGLALPRVFRGPALLFAVAYALVRLLHLGLYLAAARRGRAERSAITGFAVTVTIGMVLLLAGALVDSNLLRAVIWTAAAGIDYAGPAWLTRERLRGIQQVAVEHFAERYGSFVIICLGESVLAVGAGVGTASRHLTAGEVLCAGLALGVAVCMWWTYFDRLAATAQERLRTHPDPVLVAADAYSYLHLVVVAGIIVFAAGVRLLLHGLPQASVAGATRACLCGGLAAYLIGLWAFEWRIAGTLSVLRLAAALAVVVLGLASGGAAAWLTLTGLVLIMTAVCALETASPKA
jgi:low temperature requirement protein LtrA